MSARVGQTGGERRHWLFDPTSIEDIDLISRKLSASDVYFADTPDGENTLAIVLDRLLDELPAEQEEAVRLLYLSGLSQHKAAAIIGVTHKTVKARADKGVAAMRRRLADSVWIADLVRGMVPDGELPETALSGTDRIAGVLGALGKRRAS